MTKPTQAQIEAVLSDFTDELTAQQRRYIIDQICRITAAAAQVGEAENEIVWPEKEVKRIKPRSVQVEAEHSVVIYAAACNPEVADTDAPAVLRYIIRQARAALTAAAQVGEQTVGDMPQLAMIEKLRDELAITKDKLAAAQVGEPDLVHGGKRFLQMFDEAAAKAIATDTIERCAQVAETALHGELGEYVAAEIRKLKAKSPSSVS